MKIPTCREPWAAILEDAIYQSMIRAAVREAANDALLATTGHPPNPTPIGDRVKLAVESEMTYFIQRFDRMAKDGL